MRGREQGKGLSPLQAAMNRGLHTKAQALGGTQKEGARSWARRQPGGAQLCLAPRSSLRDQKGREASTRDRARLTDQACLARLDTHP